MSPVRAARLFSGSGDEALGVRVIDYVGRARSAHPRFAVDEERFVERLGELVSADVERLQRLAGGDLWLAHACASGCGEALAYFEAEVFGPRVAAMHRRFGQQAVVEDEAQNLRLRLLVGSEPLLYTYRGRGSLAGWLSVALARAVAKQNKRRERQLGTDVDRVSDALAADLDLGTIAERSQAKAVLSGALREAVGSLEPGARLLLKLHICDGLVIDELAALQGTHRATASRRLERARRTLAAATRTRIAEAYGLTSREIDSLLRVVRSSFQSLMQTFLAS